MDNAAMTHITRAFLIMALKIALEKMIYSLCNPVLTERRRVESSMKEVDGKYLIETLDELHEYFL